jgi:hypothetical protein
MTRMARRRDPLISGDRSGRQNGYSARKVSTGSMREARREGTNAEAKVAIATAAYPDAYAIGSKGGIT